MATAESKYAECNHCTYKMVAIAYRRAPWFRLLREPLVMGIRYFVFIHCINVSDYMMKTEACNNCIRFYKSALFRKSRLFQWLHNRINPIFNRCLGKIVTDDERSQARQYALAATEGSLSEDEVVEWMRGFKNSL